MDSRNRKRKLGATKHCAYGTCNSDSRYADRPEMDGVFFIRFPKPGKDLEKCVRWVKACSRVGFDETWVKKDTYLCSLHFIGGKGPTEDHPDPIPANATKYDVNRLKKTPRRKVRKSLVLSEVHNTDKKTRTMCPPQLSEDVGFCQIQSKDHEIAEILLSLSEKDSNKENAPVDNVSGNSGQAFATQLSHNSVQISTHSDEFFIARKIQDQSTQTTAGTREEIGLRIKNRLLENENINLKSKLELSEAINNLNPTPDEEVPTPPSISIRCDFDISELENDDKKCKFFTGLTFLQLMQVWNFVTPSVQHLKYWNRSSTKKDSYRISQKNALVMTLMRLRNGYTTQDLAYRFGTTISDVSNIILSWIQFLYSQFLPLKRFMFAECSRIRETMPLCFKKYKNIRCIIDCTEFFSQRPSNFQRQGNLYSSYKAHTTYKILVAISPNGSIMFVSDVFEGSISDREIVIKSGFLDFLNPGDSVMADRGFNIKDLLNARKVDLIIPPFLMGRKNLTPQEEALTKDIAKHRIHVERSIERMKKFKLLQKTIPLSLQPVLNQIVFIVSCLVNFQEPLVK